MENSVKDRIQQTNARLASLLSLARDALAGRRNFTVEDIRSISEPVRQMAPLVSRANDLRAIGLDADLKTYAGILEELRVALEHFRFMLLARQAHIEAARRHVEAINLWTTAYRQTQ